MSSSTFSKVQCTVPGMRLSGFVQYASKLVLQVASSRLSQRFLTVQLPRRRSTAALASRSTWSPAKATG
eukprot:6205772-Pleurochrysis_carterae.AAC.4